jgi:Bacterial Ig-like domain (group 2)
MPPTPLTVSDPLGPPILRTPVTTVTKTGDAYTVDTAGSLEAWVIVTTVGPAGSLIQLPNGLGYPPGKSVLLTAGEVALISPAAIGASPGVTIEAVTGIVIAAAGGDTLAMKLTPTVKLNSQLVLNADGAGAGAVSIGGLGDVKWSSATPAVATVDGNGLVTAKTAGTSVITAKWGGFTDTETVTVAA